VSDYAFDVCPDSGRGGVSNLPANQILNTARASAKQDRPDSKTGQKQAVGVNREEERQQIFLSD
jgi:hypothetical protein